MRPRRFYVEELGGSPSSTVFVDFLIECKRSTDPWVAFTIADQKLHADSRLAPLTWIMNDLARRHVAPVISGQWEARPSIFDDRPTAYSVVQPKLTANKDQVPFHAAEQLLAAVESKMRQVSRSAFPNTCHLIFPVIVFDGNLYEFRLTSTGETLQEVKETTLLLRERTLLSAETTKVEGFARIKIVTMQSLGDFVSRASAMSTWICGLSQDIRQAMAAPQSSQ